MLVLKYHSCSVRREKQLEVKEGQAYVPLHKVCSDLSRSGGLAEGVLDSPGGGGATSCQGTAATARKTVLARLSTLSLANAQ